MIEERNSVGAGAVLNDRQIMRRLLRGDLVVTPLLDARRQIGPTSIDIRLGFDFDTFNITKQTHLDPLKARHVLKREVESYTNKIHIPPMDRFILHPGEFALASTFEYFIVPRDLAGRLEGRSTWGRLGLQVHSTAGFVDPGFEGILTFELQNMGKGPLILFPGVRIAQICFFQCASATVSYVEKPGAKYHRRFSSAGSLFHQDWEFEAIRDYHDKDTARSARRKKVARRKAIP
jgi:dCTP deaminase